MGRHILDGSQKLEVERRNTFEHAMASGIVEGERSDALFDHGCASAVLDLVKQTADSCAFAEAKRA